MLTALMVANGANAGNLSPISTVGVIANGSMTGAGLGGHAGTVMLAGFLAHALVAALAYAWFVPGLRKAVAAGAAVEAGPGIPAFTRTQLLTFAVLTLWIAAVVGLKANLALSAFAAGVALILCRVGDETKAIARMPWGVILMVCGVATLVALVESHGGMDLFSRMIAQVASAETINGVIAFVTGAISTYSSTSGVVLPTFLPMVPGLAQATGSSDPLAIALSITVGSALVDVSPLSTIGALCVAALGKEDGDPRLYVKLLCWGFAMAIVGALLCQIFAPMLSGARPVTNDHRQTRGPGFAWAKSGNFPSDR